MRDYAELVKSMRCCAEYEGCLKCDRFKSGFTCAHDLLNDSADAIEELLALACPHHHRNVHDRGDDSYCDALNREVPKEVE